MAPSAFAIFPAITTVDALRLLTLQTLRDWLLRLPTVPLHIPASRGRMQNLPDKHFHLAPELFLQLSGETDFSFPEESRLVRSGEICIVPAGLPHGERVRRSEGSERPFFNLVFLPGRRLRFHIGHERKEGRPTCGIGDWLDGISDSCIALLGEAGRLFHNGRSAADAGARGALAAVFASLIAALEGETALPEEEPFRVMQARQQIILGLHDPSLTVSSLATRLQIHPDHLSRLFRQTTGASLQTYLLEQRLSRALELLHATSLNISEISHAAGFRDPAYFARAFRRWAGKPPREARQRRLLREQSA